MGEWMDGYLARLSEVRARNLSGGGNQYEALQHGLGKRSARERISSVVDPGTFEEMGSLVTDTRKPFDGKKRASPSDCVIIGLGRV